MLTRTETVIIRLTRVVERNFIFLNNSDRQWELNIRFSGLPVDIFTPAKAISGGFAALPDNIIFTVSQKRQGVTKCNSLTYLNVEVR